MWICIPVALDFNQDTLAPRSQCLHSSASVSTWWTGALQMQEGQGAQMPLYQQTWSQVSLLEKSVSKPQLDQVGSSMAEWTQLGL